MTTLLQNVALYYTASTVMKQSCLLMGEVSL